jgi:hypothetical protein
MSDNEKKTCQDLIQGKCDDWSIYMETLIEKINDNENSEDTYEAIEEFWNLPLEVTSKKVVNILFSTGGPADWLNVFVDSDNCIEYIEYHYQDWFDHASMKVSKNSYIYEYAERVIENLIETSEIN